MKSGGSNTTFDSGSSGVIRVLVGWSGSARLVKRPNEQRAEVAS